MSTGAHLPSLVAPSPALGVLFAGLIDDAGLFPPAGLSMAAAVAAHRGTAGGPDGWLTERFLCPASRTSELVAELAAGAGLAVGIIADSPAGVSAAFADEAASSGRFRISLVELALLADADQLAEARAASAALALLRAGVRGFVELPRVAGWQVALAVLGSAGLGAKIRCGGLAAEAFPAEAELAAFVTACVVAAIPFKATAGLHHAVRHTDSVTGFEHHGFLNLILAVSTAQRGGDVEAALAERDPNQVGAAVAGLDARRAAAVREIFVAYGSCSLGEPVQDLLTLGLLERG